MGADIHWVLEQQSPDKTWIGVYCTDAPETKGGEERSWSTRSLLVCRNYNFFAALSGVRGDGPEANGFDADASALAHLYADGGHSHSHFSLLEFCTVHTLLEFEGPGDLRHAMRRAEYREDPDKVIKKYFDWISKDDVPNYRVQVWYDS